MHLVLSSVDVVISLMALLSPPVGGFGGPPGRASPAENVLLLGSLGA